jgi:hypothetical protein
MYSNCNTMESLYSKVTRMHVGVSTFFKESMKDRSNSLQFRVDNSLGQEYMCAGVSTVDLHLEHKAEAYISCCMLESSHVSFLQSRHVEKEGEIRELFVKLHCSLGPI